MADQNPIWARRLEKDTCFTLYETTELTDMIGNLITMAINTEHDLCHYDKTSSLCDPNAGDISGLLRMVVDLENEVDKLMENRKCEPSIETPYGTKMNA